MVRHFLGVGDGAGGETSRVEHFLASIFHKGGVLGSALSVMF